MTTHHNGSKSSEKGADPSPLPAAGEAIEAELTRLLESSVKLVKKYPVQCVLGGFAAGILAGLVLRNNK